MEWVKMLTWGQPSRLSSLDYGNTLDQTCLARQKVDQLPVELLRTLFVGQVPDAREDNRLDIRKMPGQLLQGRNVHRRIFASPHQECRNWRQLWQQLLQFPQIGRPCSDDTQRMFEESRSRQRRLIAFEAFGWNAVAVGKQAPVQVTKENRHASDPRTKQRRAETGGEERRQPTPMRRVRIDWADQHQPAQPCPAATAGVSGRASAWRHCRGHRAQHAPRVRPADDPATGGGDPAEIARGPEP